MEQVWGLPPKELILRHIDVHVWRMLLSTHSQRSIDLAARALSPDEIARANRLRLKVDRNQFILTRFTLRKLLGLYLNRSSKEITFSKGRNDKPAVASDEWSDPPIEFSVARSGSIALLAFTQNAKIGVDLERVRAFFNYKDVVDQFFSASEADWLCKLAAKERRRAFFRLCTCKEAVIKATGADLSVLDQIKVPLGDDCTDQLISTTFERASWSLQLLNPGPGYEAAIASQATNFSLTLFDVQLEKLDAG